MQRGSEVHARLVERVQEARDRLEASERTVERRADELERLDARRADVLRSLARLHLPELSPAAVQGTLASARAATDAILGEKDDRRAALEESIPRQRRRADETERELADVSAALDDVERRRQPLARAVYAELEADERWRELAAEVRRTRARVDASATRRRAAIGERDEKRPAYESDPFFSYLSRRGYGTPRSAGNALTRRLDRWLARATDYEESKARYDLLGQLPIHAEEMLNRARSELASAGEPLGALEAEVVDRHGLGPVLERGERLHARKRAVGESARLAAEELRRLTRERAELDDLRGRYYERAIAEIEADLRGRASDDLAALAARTSDSEDDALVSELTALRERAAHARARLSRARDERRRLDERLGGLEEIRARFVAEDWDGHRSRFDDSLGLEALLAGYLAGTHSAAHVSQTLGSLQSFKAPDVGGFSSGSFSTGGGFGGGGFSTGGGF